MWSLDSAFQVSIVSSCGCTSRSHRFISAFSSTPSRWPRCDADDGGVLLLAEVRALGVDHDDGVAGELAGLAVPGEHLVDEQAARRVRSRDRRGPAPRVNTSSSMSRSSIGASLIAPTISAVASSSSSGGAPTRRTISYGAAAASASACSFSTPAQSRSARNWRRLIAALARSSPCRAANAVTASASQPSMISVVRPSPRACSVTASRSCVP